MNPFDITVVYVAFNYTKGGKVRPVLVIQDAEDVFIGFAITSQYENKSAHIKNNYYEIKEWQKAGLIKPSWIDVKSKAIFEKKDLKITHIIGQLTDADIVGLMNFFEIVI